MNYTKEQVYVHVKNADEAKELLQLLTESGESAYHDEVLHDDSYPYYHFSVNYWVGRMDAYKWDKNEVTIPELKQILNTMTHEQQLEQALTELETLKGKVKILLDKPKELVVGKWYKRTDNNNVIACICDPDEYNKVKSYGFCDDKWYDDRSMPTHWGYMGQVDEWREATNEEVKNALVKEAEKRGFVKGFSVKCLKEGSIHKCTDYGCFVQSGSTLHGYGACIFKDGIWAEPIDNRCELDTDIQALKDKYKEFNITVIVE